MFIFWGPPSGPLCIFFTPLRRPVPGPRPSSRLPPYPPSQPPPGLAILEAADPRAGPRHGGGPPRVPGPSFGANRHAHNWPDSNFAFSSRVHLRVHGGPGLKWPLYPSRVASLGVLNALREFNSGIRLSRRFLISIFGFGDPAP